MKAALATYKDDISPPGSANTGVSQQAAHLLECSLSCPKPQGEQNPMQSCYAAVWQNAQVCTRPKVLLVRSLVLVLLCMLCSFPHLSLHKCRGDHFRLMHCAV
jgi:hypothetical protein